MDPVELLTDRLTLRRPVVADVPAIAAACTDPWIQRYVPVPSPYTEADAREFVATAAREWESDESYAFAVHAGGALAGMAQLTRKGTGLVELGFWAAPGQRRRGYTVEVSHRLCQWGFDTLGIHRIDWWAVVGNDGSRSVAESIGFGVEGTLRQRAMLHGEPQDWWVGGLLSRPAGRTTKAGRSASLLINRPSPFGVDDGTRTRDSQNHNQVALSKCVQGLTCGGRALTLMFTTLAHGHNLQVADRRKLAKVAVRALRSQVSTKCDIRSRSTVMAPTKRRQWGSIRKQRSGRYQASYLGPDMNRYYAPENFTAKMDAEAWLVSERRVIELGQWIKPEDRIDPESRFVQFRPYAEKWLVERDLKPKTLYHYRDLLETRVYTAFGERRITAIATPMVRTWLAAQDGAPTRKKQAYGLLKAILTTAVTDGLIDSNPCTLVVKAPKRREIELLTTSQLWAVYDEMNGHYRAAVLVLSLCGLRFGECIELRRKDIRDDGSVMTLMIRRAAVKVGPEMVVGTPKSDEGIRNVVVPGPVAEVLREHMGSVGRGAEQLVFTTTRGERLSQTAFTKNFKSAVEKVTGRTDVRVHDLRHLGGTLAAQAGATTKELMDRLGHATPVMALRYQHTAAGRDAAIADRLGEIAGR